MLARKTIGGCRAEARIAYIGEGETCEGCGHALELCTCAHPFPAELTADTITELVELGGRPLDVEVEWRVIGGSAEDRKLVRAWMQKVQRHLDRELKAIRRAYEGRV